jgi:hypothetical protein
MSNLLDGFKDNNGNWTHQGSVNAGTWQGQQGQPLAPQQQNESWASYEARNNAYNSNK